mmetsp:Transcript_19566/g.28595  ORF Transcript_19566/g.28595 Transcript_19566/m.28595 type:complete len:204 (+) Transcript_19566:89-700(+)
MKMPRQRMSSSSAVAALMALLSLTTTSTISSTSAFTIIHPHAAPTLSLHQNVRSNISSLYADTTDTNESTPAPTSAPRPSEGMQIDHTEPEEAIIHIAPKAMIRLRELRTQSNSEIVLRMGVRNGGCSGLSYVMDFSTREEIGEDDAVDEYPEEGVVCVVDAKSMLYLYGLQLDYGDELIGGGFKFFNPNAEESCGCGSSFGV